MFSKKTYRNTRWIERVLRITKEHESELKAMYSPWEDAKWRVPRDGYQIHVFNEHTETWEQVTLLTTMWCGVNTPEGQRVVEGLQVMYETSPGGGVNSIALQPTDHERLRVEQKL